MNDVLACLSHSRHSAEPTSPIQRSTQQIQTNPFIHTVADTMTESTLSSEDAAAARAAEQARLRKERREAKIKAGGSARLNKITGVGGGIQRG
jgi:hypothetical protein